LEHINRHSLAGPIAIIYDFDGTLCPRPMQEESIFPELGVEPSAFWEKAHQIAMHEGGEPMLVYLRELMKEIRSKGMKLDLKSMRPLSKRITLFEGVNSWFDRMGQVFKGRELKHYIVSAGLKEILQAHPLSSCWAKIYASEYSLDSSGMPFFLKQLVTDTTKTQFLFRINKGREEVHECVNEHMDLKDRPIPFENMIYIGDGLTDVPSLAVVRQQGGGTIAVHDPKQAESKEKADLLVEVGRADVNLEADYSANGPIEKWVRAYFGV
jgi:hypothetical protein